MLAKIEKANRPKYFIRNGICVRIDNIAFVQMDNTKPYNSKDDTICSISIGMVNTNSGFPPVFIPCKSESEQSVIFTELTTILAAL